MHRLRSAFALSCLLLAVPAMAQERQRYTIPAGDAATAVQRLAIQSGVQVMVPDADLSGVTTNPVNGSAMLASATAPSATVEA